MVTKVLVFESDPAFAGELRAEFAKLGCTTTIIDDGNVGLQQAAAERPDLVLLSIELPRMNGFSVCNKLKKDPRLKDVPLIIMSSESSDETFEQHKKLRTRAEDYVHKPISFGELLQHIQAFVPLGAAMRESDTAIVIDDEIEIGSDEIGDDLSVESLADVPPLMSSSRRVESIDSDVDAFAESAFGRLTGPEAKVSEVHLPGSNGAQELTAGSHLGVGPAVGTRMASFASPVTLPTGVDPGDHERVCDELARASVRLQELGQALDEMHAEQEKLRVDAAESERLGRELDELRTKIASSPRAAGVSSREFLDLRETLNKKDKEILSIKELLSKKDKQIVEAQDRALVSERAHADVDERLLALERELEDTREKNESLAADRDLAKKASDDFRGRLEKLRAEGENKDRHVSELRARHAEELGAAEDRFAAMRAELDQILANERAEHARALDESQQRRRDELDQSRREHDERLMGARSEWEQDLAREKIDGEKRAQAALDALRAELSAKAARELGEETERSTRLSSEVATVRDEAAGLRRAREDLEMKLTASEARSESLQADLAATAQELAASEHRLLGETTRADKSQAKWQADRQSLERAKDALAVALAQIEEAEARV